jgi:hypothetical protein
MDSGSANILFDAQVKRLGEAHSLILYWCSSAEGRSLKYNLTNCFDDLKSAGITRTKQTAIAAVEALATLCFVDLKDEGNRKNIYITRHGAKALEYLVKNSLFHSKPSSFLEDVSS